MSKLSSAYQNYLYPAGLAKKMGLDKIIGLNILAPFPIWNSITLKKIVRCSGATTKGIVFFLKKI